MNIWIIIWLVFWITVMGVPNFLFKKYKITYYEKYWQHTLFFIFSLATLLFVYWKLLTPYFIGLSSNHFIIIGCLFVLFIFIPLTYKNDYYTKEERLGYQLPKFFEIIFQQFCFLGGLLTFGISPVTFGIVFFVVHIPVVLLIPRKFALSVTAASLIGGLVFALLQAQGPLGFLISLSIHLLFWATFPHFLSRNFSLGVVPIKR